MRVHGGNEDRHVGQSRVVVAVACDNGDSGRPVVALLLVVQLVALLVALY